MDPVLELQIAVIARLRSSASLAALVGERSYDEPPRDQRGLVTTKLPYVSLGPSSYLSERIDCIAGGEIMIQIDAWSDRPGQTEVRKIAHAIRGALAGTEPVLEENAVVTFEHDRTDFIIDGAIKHASVRFTATVEEPSQPAA